MILTVKDSHKTNIMQTYLFYDIETTGLSKTFDQVLQFAGIRTDRELNELERYELNVRMNPDIIPSPYALITHRIGINHSSNGISEFDAIKQIHQWLNQPGTISLGYNTLGFDDEFLRFSFYRNLLAPYHHQFKNQCGRMDIYPITLAFYLFKNSILQWPTVDNKISLKLADLKKANQLASGDSHNAMVDVLSTLQLANYFFAERDMWEYLIGFFNKEIDGERLQPLQHSIALMLDTRLRDNHYQCLVLYLGNHRHYKNQHLWLRLDTDELDALDISTIPQKTYVISKKLGEPNFILPLKNRFLDRLSPELIKRATHNKQWLESNPEIFSHIVNYHTTYQYPLYPNTDIEAGLYLNGFLTPTEENFCQRFHLGSPVEKVKITEDYPDSKLYPLALRILGRHYPDHLTPSLTKKYLDYLKKVSTENAILDFQGRDRLSPQKALREIIALRALRALDHEQLDLLTGLENYLLEKF